MIKYKSTFGGGSVWDEDLTYFQEQGATENVESCLTTTYK